MDDTDRDRRLEWHIEQVLRSTPFPGEDEAALRTYLERVAFVERVMEGTAGLHPHRRPLVWAAFSMLNLLLLFILGTNHSYLQVYLGVEQALAGFFFLFLGLSLLGGVVGFVLSLDTSWLHHFLERDA